MTAAGRPVVLTALPDEWDAGLVSALAGRVGVGRRCVDVADLLSAAEAGLGDVAVVSAQLRGLDLSVVRALRLHHVGVLGVVPRGDEAQEARLRQLGLRTMVDPQQPAAEVYAAVVRALPSSSDVRETAETAETAEEEPGPEECGGSVVVVWGPHGAPGRTSLAVNLAAELSRLDRQVTLVDLDTHAASVAQHLAVLDEGAGVAAACRAAEHGTLDVASLERLTPTVLPGLRILTGLPAAARWVEVRSGAVERVLATAALTADVVVVDCGASLEDDEELSYDTLAPRRNMAALTAIEVSDLVLVVGAADPVGLQRLVRACQDLDEVPGGAVRRLVVNKVREASVGTDPVGRVRAVLDRFVDVNEVDAVPYDQPVADQALLEGRTWRETAPRSAMCEAVAEIAVRLLEDDLSQK